MSPSELQGNFEDEIQRKWINGKTPAVKQEEILLLTAV